MLWFDAIHCGITASTGRHTAISQSAPCSSQSYHSVDLWNETIQWEKHLRPRSFICIAYDLCGFCGKSVLHVTGDIFGTSSQPRLTPPCFQSTFNYFLGFNEDWKKPTMVLSTESLTVKPHSLMTEHYISAQSGREREREEELVFSGAPRANASSVCRLLITNIRVEKASKTSMITSQVFQMWYHFVIRFKLLTLLHWFSVMWLFDTASKACVSHLSSLKCQSHLVLLAFRKWLTSGKQYRQQWK